MSATVDTGLLEVKVKDMYREVAEHPRAHLSHCTGVSLGADRP